MSPLKFHDRCFTSILLHPIQIKERALREQVEKSRFVGIGSIADIFSAFGFRIKVSTIFLGTE